jgi:hypothetical protein
LLRRCAASGSVQSSAISRTCQLSPAASAQAQPKSAAQRMGKPPTAGGAVADAARRKPPRGDVEADGAVAALAARPPPVRQLSTREYPCATTSTTRPAVTEPSSHRAPAKTVMVPSMPMYATTGTGPHPSTAWDLTPDRCRATTRGLYPSPSPVVHGCWQFYFMYGKFISQQHPIVSRTCTIVLFLTCDM